ncbi:Insulin receptor substrate 2 [Acipenser ruthenus]|uniref:Insulin receptor substrate 2 n=1 Tax=Acipenser ruthenus TaxID=7906 RepID=A0A662Z0C9_ACIRT|nr:Insulin receptor substrate 2 [Acipenser ruthenus]
MSGAEAFMVPGPSLNPDRGAKVIRADPQGRRRHSSETFSSTTTVTPVFPSFAHDPKRHSSASVENVSLRKSEGSEEEYGSPMCRETSAGFQNGLNYIALDLMDDSLGKCENIVRLKTANYFKGGTNGIDSSLYASIGFLKENTAATQESGKESQGCQNIGDSPSADRVNIRSCRLDPKKIASAVIRKPLPYPLS